MDYKQFVLQVQEETGFSEKNQAVKAIQATLKTLAERLFQDEAEHLAAQLPREIQSYLLDVREHHKFDVDDFVRLIGEREGVNGDQAEAHARAVIAVLTRAVSPGEIEDVVSQLPKGFKKLFGEESETVH